MTEEPPRLPPDGAARGPGDALKGIAWMVLTGFFFVAVTGLVRHLGTDMNPVQAAFLRYAFGFLFLAPSLLRVLRRPPPGRRLALHACRGVMHGIGVMLWFFAMTRLPIAQVTALGFTAPIVVTIGAALFLGERFRLRRLIAVLVGFAGMVVILRPGLGVVDVGALAQIAAAPLFAASILIAKRMTLVDDNATIVALMALFVTFTLMGPALYFWEPPTLEQLGLLLATALVATLGHMTMMQAIRVTEVAVTQPITFLQLIWATVIGFLIFDEEPDLATWIGGAVIVASATYIAHRESRLRRFASAGRTGG